MCVCVCVCVCVYVCMYVCVYVCIIKQNINLDHRLLPPSLFPEPTRNKHKQGSSLLLVSTLRVGRPIVHGSTLDRDMVSVARCCVITATFRRVQGGDAVSLGYWSLTLIKMRRGCNFIA